jgi:7-cyano-7-deazaguanine synthase
MPKKAVILLSGGLDSLTCLALAKAKSYEIYTLNFDYGQRHAFEMKSAQKIASTYNVKEHKTITINFNQLGGSALTDYNLNVPSHYEKKPEEIPITYVPARNTIFISCGLGYAEIINAGYLFIGASSVDYSGYPDCRPEYFQAFQLLANLATKTAIEGEKIEIVTPLLNLTKTETIQLGLSLGVDYSLSTSCYQVTPEGLACGKCDSCFLRKKGFEEANVADPTLYVYS